MRMEPATVRAKLLAWYRAHRRDLPWRRRRDAYSIWISEVMLQQTRVDTVIPYYERFLARWPDVASLAAADPDEVRAVWSGLGYYRRARLMMDAARVIVDEHAGQIPADLDALSALPGFGRYTSGAVASIAFDLPAPAVDGNVSRVLARLDAIDGDLTRGEPQRKVWSLANRLAPGESPGDFTQALIELGALICATKRPKCLLCPVSDACRARAEGRIDQIPAPRPKPTRKSVELTGLIWVCKGDVLLEKQADGGLFASLWTPPMIEGRPDDDALAEHLRARFKRPPTEWQPAGSFKHVLTHRDLNLALVRLAGPRPRVTEPLRWIPLTNLEAWGVPSLTIKALRTALDPDDLAGIVLPGRARRDKSSGAAPAQGRSTSRRS